MTPQFILLILCATETLCESDDESFDIDGMAKNWLHNYNAQLSELWNTAANAVWNYNTNLDDKEKQATAAYSGAQLVKFGREKAEDAAAKFNKYWFRISEPENLRQIKLAQSVVEIDLGTQQQNIGIKLSSDEEKKLTSLVADMQATYSNGRICPYNSSHPVDDCAAPNIPLSPDISFFMRNNTNYDILEYVWKSWHDSVGRAVKQNFTEYVELQNKGARNAGYKDMGDAWRSLYEDENFETDTIALMHELLPLYEQLHAYVRKHLRNKYSDHFKGGRFPTAIPAHLLGNMWSQTWDALFTETAPFPNEESVDITESLNSQNYTVLRMFEDADNFFASLGLEKVPAVFWGNAQMEKPHDRNTVCHGSAWDFSNEKDFRILMCAGVNMQDYITVHHEMGHVQYYMQYANQPVLFRTGANPGFHEAIGDTISLAVQTPKHLRTLGLLGPNTEPQKHRRQQLNFLYLTALKKVAFLPFGFLVDQWRYRVFGGVPEERWNADWNGLRWMYQGIVPPVGRKDPRNLDAGAKFHIPSSTPYIRYFVSYVIQFQFYERLCEVSGHNGPLSECDFYNSTIAGDLLRDVLQAGKSVKWQDTFEKVTGSRKMSAKSLINYFEPVMEWLKEQNEGECFGWGFDWPAEVAATLPQPRCGRYDDEV